MMPVVRCRRQSTDPLERMANLESLSMSYIQFQFILVEIYR
jgi:hypothetical protein